MERAEEAEGRCEGSGAGERREDGERRLAEGAGTHSAEGQGCIIVVCHVRPVFIVVWDGF